MPPAPPELAPAVAAAPSATPRGAHGPGQRYRENLPRDLIGISRHLQDRVRSALGARGFCGLRPSFGPFLALLWGEDRPLSEFARELGISAQACSQLATRIERAGYVERLPNPEDRRSKLVRLTRRGRALALEGVRVIFESEREYAAILGARDTERLGATLAALFRGLELPAHSDPALLTRAGRSLGVVPLVAVRIQRELMEATIARGHAGLRMSHAQVIPFVANEGGRIHEIARRQRVSRQAIHAVARELEQLGYVAREPDPHDGRGVLLHLTPRGHALVAESIAAVEELEARIAAILGARRVAWLAGTARRLHDALEARNAADIHALATRLRRRLGHEDAARLAELLDTPSATPGDVPRVFR